jgi:uncharacterized membrane protein
MAQWAATEMYLLVCPMLVGLAYSSRSLVGGWRDERHLGPACNAIDAHGQACAISAWLLANNDASYSRHCIYIALACTDPPTSGLSA